MAKIFIAFLAIFSIGLALSTEEPTSFLSVEAQFANPDNNHFECARRTPKSLTGDSTFVRFAIPFQLKHVLTGKFLHSHFFNNIGGSAQQQVTGFSGDDIGNYWTAKYSNGATCFAPVGDRVRVGDVIRLENIRTLRNLHAEPGVASQITRQGEVTAYGLVGLGDDNDDWRVDIPGKKSGDLWKVGDRVRLFHKKQGCTLHSHGLNYPSTATGQQEVTCYNLRDDNDLWIVSYNP